MFVQEDKMDKHRKFEKVNATQPTPTYELLLAGPRGYSSITGIGFSLPVFSTHTGHSVNFHP